MVQQLTGQIERQRSYGRWEYTLTEAARVEAGFELMETYIWQRQNAVTQYIATRSLLVLCEAAERKWGGTGGDVVVGTGTN